MTVTPTAAGESTAEPSLAENPNGGQHRRKKLSRGGRARQLPSIFKRPFLLRTVRATSRLKYFQLDFLAVLQEFLDDVRNLIGRVFEAIVPGPRYPMHVRAGE